MTPAKAELCGWIVTRENDQKVRRRVTQEEYDLLSSASRPQSAIRNPQ